MLRFFERKPMVGIALAGMYALVMIAQVEFDKISNRNTV